MCNKNKGGLAKKACSSRNKDTKLVVLMLGQHLGAGGGVAEVINQLTQEAGEKTDLELVHVPTSYKKGLMGQRYFFYAILKIIYAGIRKNLNGAHIHLCARGSTVRKIVFSWIFGVFKIPYVVQLHSGDYQVFYQKTPLLAQKMIAQLLKKASAVVVLSNDARGWIKSEFKLSNVAVIVNGVSDCNPGPQQKFRDKHILYAGRVVKTKGLDELIRSIAIVKIKIGDVRLTILGDGDLDFYKELSEELDIRDSVDFKGWCDRKEVIKSMKEHKVFVLPSWFEGLPMSMLEAMSTQTPVVVTSVGAIPDIIINKVNGFVCPPRDPKLLAEALIQCLEGEELADRIAAAGRKDFEEAYSSKEMLSSYHKLYKEFFVPR